LQRVIFARAKDPAISPEAQRDDLVFLGQLHGYLAGPYEDLESERLLVSLRDEVAAQMPLRALSVFEEAERSVQDRYERISIELEGLVAAGEEARQAETEAKLAELEARREDLKDDKSKIDPEREKITDVSRETLGALSEAEMLAASSVQTAQRQAEALRIEYRGVLRGLELLYMQRRANQGENPMQGNGNAGLSFFPNRINLFWQALNNLEAQMDALQRDHAQLNFNFQQIRQQRLASETELQQNVARLAWDDAQIERELEALKKQAEKVVDPKRKVSPEVRVKEREMISFGTYVDFSLEVPRAAALAALKSR
jgi:hypothetical protein